MPVPRSGVRRGRPAKQQPNPEQGERGIARTRRRRVTPKKNQQQQRLIDENIAAEARAQVEAGRILEGAGDIGGGGEKEEGEAAKEMDDNDSGARSGDRAHGGEDEGTTAPIPEKVLIFMLNVIIILLL